MTEKRKSIQKKYYDSHVYDELFLFLKREYVSMNEVHEIMHGKDKTYEPWNMISLTYVNHKSAHDSAIPKRLLFIAKIFNEEIEFPEEIIRKFDLGIFIRNREKFRKKWLMHIYKNI